MLLYHIVISKSSFLKENDNYCQYTEIAFTFNRMKSSVEIFWQNILLSPEFFTVHKMGTSIVTRAWSVTADRRHSSNLFFVVNVIFIIIVITN